MSVRSSRIALCCKGSPKLQAAEERVAVGRPAVGTGGLGLPPSFLRWAGKSCCRGVELLPQG
ncbi:hypothetical protein I79_004458 [Cricetulus griseus]|uniref:Uncharacterized protein n=1 Tax=Cricetulus griseus TaxID=10029 RepID=G3H2P0_CRIGR|nr:hypothetical protein I79_004458 [Cricetulus griseus]